jgi:anti-sigma28 factor (negative regulator of flagellin synthesis)
MMEVNSIQPTVSANAVEPAGVVNDGAPVADPRGTADVVEISNAAKLAARVDQIPEVRTELVERVRAEIAAGTYETSEKIEIAAAKLLDELFGD